MPAHTTAIDRSDITGLVLAGGEGRRMGGLDKGLQSFHGRPLAAWALARLAPQVGPLWISANRHLGDYAALGVPVLPDAHPRDAAPMARAPMTHADPMAGAPMRYAGPMAGVCAGLVACTTPWLLCVPCDSPAFPLDLAARLAAGLQAAQAPLAMACTPAEGDDPAPRRHPVFCLLSVALRPSLQAFLDRGERKFDVWGAQQGRALVAFDDARGFRNLNTADALRALEGETPPA